MNADKAREYYSAHLEGTLDRGLKQAFERRLETDPELQAEYDAFVETTLSLSALSQDVPEPEFDLHEHIMARLDRHIHEQKRKPLPWYAAKWRAATVTGVCVLALFGAVLSFRPGGTGWMQGLFPSSEATIGDVVSVSRREGVTMLAFRTGGEKTLTVKSVETGEELTRVHLDGRGQAGGAALRSPLQYDSERPVLVRVDIEGSERRMLIALPGTETSQVMQGHGSISEFALALAGRYGVTVVLAADSDQTLAWDFSVGDAVASATETVKGTTVSVEHRAPGVIWLQ